MSYTEVIKDIEELPYYRDYVCKQCGQKQKVYILEIYAVCSNCKTKSKVRGYASIGSEIEDVIDTVLEWLGDGDEFNLSMMRKRIIDLGSEEL